MTESPGNEPGSMLFDRIRRMVDERGVDIRLYQNGNALRLEFADGQRVVINFDARSSHVWLASASGGIEFIHQNGNWHSHDQGDFFAKLKDIVEQTIASNPINARAPTPEEKLTLQTETAVHTEVRENHLRRNMLIMLLAGVAGLWAAQQLYLQQHPERDSQQTRTLSLNKLHYPCEGSIPANGSVTLFPDSGLKPGNPDDPEIILKNDHSHPVLLILSAPHTAIPAMSILVHARNSATVHIPAGHYDMMFSVGKTWCNPRSGFSEGQLLKFDKPLNMQTGKTMQLAMQTSGPGMQDFQLFVKTGHPELDLPPPTFNGDGSMEVQRHANGHFYVPGTIENMSVTFMVDTGASVTSISSELARAAGISNCKEVQFQTANGNANGCIALLPRMTLGNFVLKNITVAVMPNLETSLLGANVLSNFQVSQNASSMLIERR